MKDIYSSRNEVVDKIGQMHFSGNIIPTTWYKTIVRDNKKPYLNAIIILSDVVKSILVCKFLGYHFVVNHPA